MNHNAKSFESGPQKAYHFFQTVKNELKTQNRFFNKQIDELINRYISNPRYTTIIDDSLLLYRGRIYDNPDAAERFRQTGLQFQGYDAQDSFVNLNYNTVREGRCNPQFIPYLYAAISPGCCIHEIHPNIESFISIAEIKVMKSLKILDLSQKFFLSDVYPQFISGVPDSTIFLYLARLFSTPFQNEGDYILTQYIAEKVKNANFDGLAYRSAVFSGEGNTNYVIFHFDKCLPISSKLYKVTDIKIETETR